MTFDEATRALHAGEITFDEYVRHTRSRWEKLAHYIMRRWRLPIWAAHEDIVQELLLGAWNNVWKYEPKCGGTLSRYVVWNAVDYAKKKAHKARGASRHRGADGNPGAPEVTFSQLGITDGWAQTVLGAVAPEQHDRLEESELHRAATDVALSQCETLKERIVIRALSREGSLAAAAKRIYADWGERLDCRFGSEFEAMMGVVHAAAEVAARLA